MTYMLTFNNGKAEEYYSELLHAVAMGLNSGVSFNVWDRALPDGDRRNILTYAPRGFSLSGNEAFMPYREWAIQLKRAAKQLALVAGMDYLKALETVLDASTKTK